MKKFNPVNRPIQPSYTLELLTTGYNTMEQGHKEAIKAASDLQTAVASLDLNEAEDEFRQIKVNEIKQTINDNLVDGSAYAALPNIIAKAGNIASDPQMLGRLRAQREFKSFQDKIDAAEIPDNYKQYYKEKNQYYYEDKIDDKGNIIGGSEWKPITTPIKTVDINDVYKLAAQYASPDSGAVTGMQFINADGSVSNKWEPGSTINVLNTRTNTWERLTEDKLKYGLEAAMRANPAIRASLEQDYKVANWQYDKDGIGRNIFNEDGSRKTFNEYVESIVDPWVKAKKYNNYTSKEDYNTAFLNQLAKGSGETIPMTNNPNFTLNHGKNIQYKDTSAVETFAKVQNANAKARSVISKLLPDIDPNAFNINDISSIETALRNKGINEREINDVIDYVSALHDANKEDVINYNEIMKNGNKKGVAAYQMYSSLETGTPINPELYNDNSDAKRIVREYQDMVENYFDIKNGGTGIRQVCTDKNRLNRFIKNIGGQQALEGLGIKITYDESGDAMIDVPAEIGTRMNKFTEAYIKAYNDTNPFLKAGNQIKRAWFNKGDSAFRIYDNGNTSKLTLLDKSKARHNAGTYVGAVLNQVGTAIRAVDPTYLGQDVAPDEMYSPFTIFKNRMETLSQTAVGSYDKTGETLYAPGVNVAAANLFEMAKDITDSKTLTALKKAIDINTDLMLDHLVQNGMNNTGLQVYNDDTERYEDVSTADIADIQNYIQNSEKTAKATGSVQFIPNVGQFGYEYTVPVKDGKAPKRFRFIDFKDTNLQELNSNPELAGIAAVTRAFDNNRILYLGNSELGDLYARAKIDEEGNKYFESYFDDDSKSSNLSIKQVQKIKGVDTRMRYLAKNINTDNPEFVNTFNKYLEANLGVLSNNPEIIKQRFIETWNNYAKQ